MKNIQKSHSWSKKLFIAILTLALGIGGYYLFINNGDLYQGFNRLKTDSPVIRVVEVFDPINYGDEQRPDDAQSVSHTKVVNLGQEVDIMKLKIESLNDIHQINNLQLNISPGESGGASGLRKIAQINNGASIYDGSRPIAKAEIEYIHGPNRSVIYNFDFGEKFILNTNESQEITIKLQLNYNFIEESTYKIVLTDVNGLNVRSNSEAPIKYYYQQRNGEEINVNNHGELNNRLEIISNK